jgi:F420-0:gamma-glutamyl ligase
MSAKLPSKLVVQAIQTRIFHAKEELVPFLIEHIPQGLIADGVIIAITSKLVSIAEGNFASKLENETSPEARAEKKQLVEKEADVFIGETRHHVSLTLKHGLLLPSAGIDESNSESGAFILYPKTPYPSAETIGLAFRKHYGIKNLGIILTDSHSTPLRSGVTGIGLSHFGFKATRSLIGQNDLFGRAIKATQVNVLDALSVAAVFEMGESDDACPIAIISGARGIEFTDSSSPAEIQISLENDLYFTLPNPKKNS